MNCEFKQKIDVNIFDDIRVQAVPSSIERQIITFI